MGQQWKRPGFFFSMCPTCIQNTPRLLPPKLLYLKQTGTLPHQEPTWGIVKVKLSGVGRWVARGKEPFVVNQKSQCLRWGPKEGKSWRGEAACGVRACGCLLAASFLVAFCPLRQEQPRGSGHPLLDLL